MRQGVEVVEVGMVGNDYDVDDNERVFRVGDLVEFWAGPVVRGYRTDSGDPAFVKEIHGLGWYGIKMVGSFGGRNRRVFWKNLFKDGTFQKQVGKGGGARVRTKGRMQERANDDAEAKFGAELRLTKRELQKSEMDKADMEKQAEERLKVQEMKSRKAEKDLTAVHKRQLRMMLEDNSADKQTLKDDEEDRERKSRKRIRDLKKEVEALTDKVGLGLDGEAHLQRQLEKERQTRTTLEGRVGTFREKIADLDKRTWEKDDSVRDLRAEVSEKERKLTTMQKRVERVDTQNKTVVEKLEQERAALVEDLVKSNNEVSLWATHNSEVPPYPEPFPT